MPLDKVPGVNGISTNFLREFWEDLKGILTQVIQKAAKEGFPIEMARAVISLLEKSNRDLLLIANWRPISLLNVDFKILSKVLANRLYKVLPKIIHKDQTGFLPKRGLCDNILDLLAALDWCESKKIQALLGSFDFEKAFDSVEHNIIFDVMETMNFGEKFISYAQASFSNMISCTMNNSFTLNYFRVTRGLRQGDPFSAPCFDLIAEVIGQKIRQNKLIQGISNDEGKKHAQYADDLWALIKATQDSYDAILKEFKDFKENTGLKINYDKTQVLRVGSLRHSNAKFYSEKLVQWSEKTKILGFNIRSSMEKTCEDNFQEIIKKFSNVLNAWKSRSQTLLGKVTVYNTAVVPIAIQKLTCLPTPPNSFFKEIKKLVLAFLWSGKRPKIAYYRLIQSYEKGGLKLVDLQIKEAALKCAVVKKQKTWTFFHGFSTILPITIPRIWDCNIECRDIKLTDTQKYSISFSILCAWAKYNFTEVDIDNLAAQCLWLNSYVRKGDRPFICKQLVRNRIFKVKDMVKDNRLKTLTELNQGSNHAINFLTYISICKSIPKNWKKWIGEGAVSNLDECDKYVSKDKNQNLSLSKIAYQKLCEKTSEPDTARIVWNAELNCDFSIEQWELLRGKTFRELHSTKLRFFQYRIFSRRLVTNIKRSLYVKEVLPLCYFCGEKPETVKTYVFGMYCSRKIQKENI